MFGTCCRVYRLSRKDGRVFRQTQFHFIICLLVGIAGCYSVPIQVAEHAVPVVRTSEGGSWLTSRESVRFNGYEIVDRSQGGNKVGFRQVSFRRDKLRKESTIEFTLRKDGEDVATVSGRTMRKMRKLPTRLGNIRSDESDLLDGQIALRSGATATFSLASFNSRDLNAVATGTVVVASQDVEIREVRAPWNDYRAGFAGAEFFRDGKMIGQVLIRKDEHVWVDSTLPADVRTTLNAVCALLLIAEPLDPHAPHHLVSEK